MRLGFVLVMNEDEPDGTGLPRERPDAEKLAGQRLRDLRQSRGWSQREVAERMKAYGYDWQQATVQRIEAATRPIRLNEVIDLAVMFGVSLDDLLVGLTAGLDDIEAVNEEIAEYGAFLREAEAEMHRALGALADATARRTVLEEEARAAEARASQLKATISDLAKLRRRRADGPQVTG